MALTKTNENDKIEVVLKWNIQVRNATIIKDDGTTSIWTSENFTAQDAAVTAGKNKIAAL